MTQSRFETIWAATPGTGAICTTPDGREILYFYADFAEEGDGIDRAMSKLYPLLQKDVFARIEFVSKAKITPQKETEK